jgi:elongation factor Ts
MEEDPMAITAQMVKELREMTGAGMMDCKNALKETDGDMEKAVDLLRKKGLASAKKRAGRTTDQGIIESYIHPGGKLGVLLELRCETDFVARTDDFRTLARDITMHIAASDPVAISSEHIPEELIQKEKDIYRIQAKESGKPEKILDKIAEGRLKKFYKESCLLEQDFVKNTDLTVQELIDTYRSKLGENITVERFSRFQIGK